MAGFGASEIIGAALLAGGFFFILTAGVGVVRLPDFYTRLHAIGKCDTAGLSLTILGLAVLSGSLGTTVKLVLISVFVAIANPTAAHALGRAAHRSGLPPFQNSRPAPAERLETNG